LSQLFIQAVTQSRLNVKTKTTNNRQLYKTHNLSVVFHFQLLDYWTASYVTHSCVILILYILGLCLMFN